MKKFNPHTHDQHLTAEQIQQYLEGKLAPAQMHTIEKHTLDCPFCADALEGYESTGTRFVPEILLPKEKASPVWSADSRRIAAVVLLLIVAGGIYFMVNQISLPDKPVATTNEKEVPEESQTLPENEYKTPSENKEKEEVTIQPPVSAQAPPPAIAADNKPTKADASEIAYVLDEEVTAEEADSEEKDESVAIAVAPQVMDKQAPEEIAEEEPETAREDGYVSNALSGRVAGVQLSPERKKESTSAPIRIRGMSSLSKSVAAGRVIKGKVTSAEDGEPLPGVAIQVDGTGKGTTTNIDGEYEITVPETRNALTYRFYGFEDYKFTLSDTSTVVMARLEEDSESLDEVVVTAYGFSQEDAEETFELAKPVNGKQAYKEYLEQNIRYPNEALDNSVEGTVRLKVTISPNGAYKEILVKKSLGYGLDEEAIRLVKEGPAWLPARKNDSPVEDTVVIKVKFKLPEK